MLHIPSKVEPERYVERVMSIFQKSGHFSQSVPGDVFLAERDDLLNGDVPYFWVNSTEDMLRHHRCVFPEMRVWRPVSERLEDLLAPIGSHDRTRQSDFLDAYLSADMEDPKWTG
jgi:hypothetical protein